MWRKLREFFFGRPKDVNDPEIFQHVSLIAFLAWVGLGADGLSSSAYGPEQAFEALKGHSHLGILLALMTAITIVVISIAYSNLIEHFPGGGGGYLVASKLLGKDAGVISGCALLVDYFLTITVSVVAGCDAMWSLFPPWMVPYKVPAEFIALIFLMWLNMRGVKESVTFIAPIFMVFVVSHFFIIVFAIGSHFMDLPRVVTDAATDFQSASSTMGLGAVLMILLRAYCMGGGTYTGIEAVSNGLGILREPRVQTGKKTMFLMAGSLAFTAGGILLGYLLTNATPVPGKTMNAVLVENLFATWMIGGFAVGKWIVVVSLLSEAALLFVAAQTGFLGGPQVLANMAVDSWMPHRFSQLSDRLVTQNGVYLMGIAALGALAYSRGHITTLVVMYSINVFVTFTLTELGMSRRWIVERKNVPNWKSLLAIHGTGLVMCLCILLVTLFEKFMEGGWMTTIVTGATIGLCYLIRNHYREVQSSFKRLDELLTTLPVANEPGAPAGEMQRNAPTAVVLVNRWSGFGIHQLLSIQRLFPNYFKNFIFVTVGVVDSGNFKGAAEIDGLEAKIKDDLEKYVAWCRHHGFHADYRMEIDIEVVRKAQEICRDVAKEFPRAICFAGKLIFQEERMYHDILHNETAASIQRQLQFDGIQTIILPIRVL
ncbi:MAG: APC family permease [Elusimicrobia bacterium]|nr:APC family permease [Elusimicrobiota bacterium]